MTLVQAKQLMDQGIMLKHPHCNGYLMMENGNIKLSHKDGGGMTDLGSPNIVIPILSKTMTDDWDIVSMEDIRLTKSDVIKIVGRFPDEITSTKRLISRVWLCSKCGHVEDGPYTPNDPCGCGSIFWEGYNTK